MKLKTKIDTEWIYPLAADCRWHRMPQMRATSWLSDIMTEP